jgi:cytochrome c peroxidase
MQLYSNNFHYANSRGDWRFVTTDSIDTLRPILEGYGQEIEKFIDVETGETQDISHLLKVYLIDQQSMIRNIYSVSFLHADLLLNDVRSLLMPLEGQSVQKLNSPAGSKYSRPGDGKDGYESSNYETDSLALALREGRPVNLYNLIESPPLGLPPVPQPSGNIATPEKIKLGRKLFFDRRLSINDTFSCAMCHIPDQGFTSNEMATAVGVEGRSVRRNSPTLYNIAYMDSLFYDAREDNLEQQIWSPFLSRNEMANPSIGYLLGKIRSFPDYDNLFEAAFKGRPVAMDTLGMALAAYQRTLVSGNSAFDRWHFGGEDDVITDEAKRGYDLFIGRAGCSNCHLINEDHALFTDNKLHNTGLGFENSIGSGSGPVRVTLAPGVFLNVDPDIVNTVGEKPPADLGRYEITEDPADRWKYRTPTLRNIALTAPFMHNGRFSSLNEVVAFYNRGGVPHDLQSSLIRPLGLTVQEQNDLVAFMETLTGDNADALVLDAFAAPVGDPIQNDGSVH